MSTFTSTFTLFRVFILVGIVVSAVIELALSEASITPISQMGWSAGAGLVSATVAKLTHIV